MLHTSTYLAHTTNSTEHAPTCACCVLHSCSIHVGRKPEFKQKSSTASNSGYECIKTHVLRFAGAILRHLVGETALQLPIGGRFPQRYVKPLALECLRSGYPTCCAVRWSQENACSPDDSPLANSVFAQVHIIGQELLGILDIGCEVDLIPDGTPRGCSLPVHSIM